MNNVLTSWKDIARYLGKGVRTVQRWELLLGLPVRRPTHNTRAVLAIPEEIDAWLLRQTSLRSIPASAETLPDKLARLERENAELRSRLAQLGHTFPDPRPDDPPAAHGSGNYSDPADRP